MKRRERASTCRFIVRALPFTGLIDLCGVSEEDGGCAVFIGIFTLVTWLKDKTNWAWGWWRLRVTPFIVCGHRHEGIFVWLANGLTFYDFGKKLLLLP